MTEVNNVMFETLSPGDLKEYIDYDDALRRFRGNTGIFKHLLGSYLAENPYEEFCEAIAAGDFVLAERHAHTLKGVAANMSLTALCDVSTQANEELKQGEIAAQTEEKLAAVMLKTTEYVTWLSENM
jgi:HPt (histidine-containing phosphotransfer) domain-containing protein